jgi:hypothetical protein
MAFAVATTRQRMRKQVVPCAVRSDEAEDLSFFTEWVIPSSALFHEDRQRLHFPKTMNVT